jgi:hypothetical protein
MRGGNGLRGKDKQQGAQRGRIASDIVIDDRGQRQPATKERAQRSAGDIKKSTPAGLRRARQGPVNPSKGRAGSSPK